MTKLSSASIRLVQKKNRMNRLGEYPIYICVCFNGRVEKATGVSCLEKHWDSRSEVVRRGCPNAPVLNKMLQDIKNRVITRKNEFEYNQRKYTAGMLLEEYRVELNASKNDFKLLMDSLIKERRLKWKTQNKYKYTFSKIREFLDKDSFIIDELNISFVKDFVRWLSDSVNDNTIRNILGDIASVWNYGISKGVCERKDYPFLEYKFTRKFPFKGRDYAIDLINMKKLKEYWLDLCIERSGRMWHYRDGVEERLMKRTSKEFGIMYFLAMYHLNGSAPIDVTKLEVSDCERISIEGVDYWSVNFKRLKTGTNVNVRLKRNLFSIIMLEHFLGRSKGKYVYPIITEHAKTDKQIIGCCNKAGESAIKWVRKAFEEINQKTIENNVSNKLEEPLVDVRKVVLYSARHSFASNYLNSPGATVMGAASLLSRSPNTISVYIHQLQGNKAIADAVSFLDD